MRQVALQLPTRNPYNRIKTTIKGKESMLTPVLSVSHPCNETADLLKHRLMERGWTTLQTFDLQDALLGIDGCSCPHHGTQECDCHMIVLLVYGLEPEPVTLILHGSDGQTWVAFADNAQQKARKASMTAIRDALEVNPTPST